MSLARRSRQPRAPRLLALAALAGGAAAWLLHLALVPSPAPVANAPAAPAPTQTLPDPEADLAALLDSPLDPSSPPDARQALGEQLRAALRRPGLRADELILSFKDAESARRFLALARAGGFDVLGRLDSAHALRVRVGDYAAFVGELADRAGELAQVSPNPILATPPPPEERLARAALPVGEHLFAVLGLEPGTDRSQLGRGVLVAVLDGGAAADPTLGARLRYQDIGYGLTGLGADGAHGSAGADRDYGRGTVNLGWALDRTNPARVDPAVSAQNYNPADHTVSFVVQNRGAQPLSGLGLGVRLGGETTNHALPPLAPGASTTVSLPLDTSRTAPGSTFAIASSLVLPPGLADRVPGNNQRSGTLSLPAN